MERERKARERKGAGGKSGKTDFACCGRFWLLSAFSCLTEAICRETKTTTATGGAVISTVSQVVDGSRACGAGGLVL